MGLLVALQTFIISVKFESFAQTGAFAAIPDWAGISAFSSLVSPATVTCPSDLFPQRISAEFVPGVNLKGYWAVALFFQRRE